MGYLHYKLKFACLIAILVWPFINIYSQYSGGSGTPTDPYQIESINDLILLSNSTEDWDKSFILTQEIDASETRNLNQGKGFNPIGDSDTTFSGNFYGNNFTISKLFISREYENIVGLFGIFDKGQISNLRFDSCHIEGKASVGVLAGIIYGNESDSIGVNNIHVTNSYVSGTVSVGGIAGGLYSKIINCSFSGDVVGYYSTIGGLVGGTSTSETTIIMNCQVNATIVGGSYVGGIVGNSFTPIYDCNAVVTFVKNNDYQDCYFGGIAGKNISSINRCYTVVNFESGLTEMKYIGGIVADHSGFIINCHSQLDINCPGIDLIGGIVSRNEGSVRNSYSSGSINGNDRVGGIIAISKDDSQVLNCYSTTLVVGNNYTGGFIGENSYFGTVNNCYSSGEVISDGWFSGGFAGINRSTASTINCFYDIITSDREAGIGMDHNGNNQEITGLFPDEFMDSLIFINTGWDFGFNDNEPWQIGTASDGILRPIFNYQTFIVHFDIEGNGKLFPSNPFKENIRCGKNSSSIEAIPDEGHYFLKWVDSGGDSISCTNPIIIEGVVKDSFLIAIIEKIDGIPTTEQYLFNVYPNPANTIINIDFERVIGANHTLIIRNIHGQQVLRKDIIIEHINLDISHFQKGLYIVHVSNGEKTQSRRVVVY